MKRLLSVLAIMLTASFMPLPAQALTLPNATPAIQPIEPSGGVTTPYTSNCAKSSGQCHVEKSVIATLFGKIMSIVLLLAGILATLFLVYNGILYITSAGDDAKMKKARGNILNIIIGIIIIVAAYAIISVAQLLGGFASNLQ